MKRRLMVCSLVAVVVTALGCAADEGVRYIVTTEDGVSVTCEWFRYYHSGPRCNDKPMDIPLNQAITIKREVRP